MWRRLLFPSWCAVALTSCLCEGAPIDSREHVAATERKVMPPSAPASNPPITRAFEPSAPSAGPPLAPLARRALPAASSLEIDVPVGVTAPARLVVVLVEARAACDEWSSSLSKSNDRFVLCVPGASESAKRTETARVERERAEREKQLRRGIAALKKAYDEYVAEPPIVLVADEARADDALAWALAEPSFFADVLAFVPSTRRLRGTELHAFGARGGRRFGLVAARDAETDRLLASARSTGIDFRWFESRRGGQAEALAWLLGSPPR